MGSKQSIVFYFHSCGETMIIFFLLWSPPHTWGATMGPPSSWLLTPPYPASSRGWSKVPIYMSRSLRLWAHASRLPFFGLAPRGSLYAYGRTLHIPSVVMCFRSRWWSSTPCCLRHSIWSLARGSVLYSSVGPHEAITLLWFHSQPALHFSAMLCSPPHF